jgi:hypothetical protein
MLSGQVGASTSSAVLEFGGGPASVSSSRLRTPAAADNTNVVRLFNLLDLSDRATQVAYYDPGVGTFSSPGAWSPPARLMSRYAGLMFGAGLRENLGQAYSFLMETYEPGDRIFVFGVSRGAYNARALTGMLDVFGVFRKGSENLVPYAVSAYAKQQRQGPALASKGCPNSSGHVRASFAALGVRGVVSSKYVNVVAGTWMLAPCRLASRGAPLMWSGWAWVAVIDVNGAVSNGARSSAMVGIPGSMTTRPSVSPVTT